jgi:hypothetical protein
LEEYLAIAMSGGSGGGKFANVKCSCDDDVVDDRSSAAVAGPASVLDVPRPITSLHPRWPIHRTHSASQARRDHLVINIEKRGIFATLMHDWISRFKLTSPRHAKASSVLTLPPSRCTSLRGCTSIGL